MPEDDPDAVLARARSGDSAARSQIARASNLKTARIILGDSAKDRVAAIRELVRADGPAPTLGLLLAAVADDPAEDLERAVDHVIRQAGAGRWPPAERAAIRAFAARHGDRLGAEVALQLVEWAAQGADDPGEVIRGAAVALANVDDQTFEQLVWRAGFERFVMEGGDLVTRWSATPGRANRVAGALLSAHARERGSCIPVLEQLWQATRRDVWAGALAEATAGHRGMRGRDEVAAWGWRRFCDHPDERRELYAAFRPWRERWIELRNAMPARSRPGGESAVAHLALWAALDVEQLAAVVDEAVRLAGEADWAPLVDATFDLAEAAPLALRRHALAGACRIAHAVTGVIRQGGAAAAGGDRLIARAEGLAARLRADGAVLDEIVANRIEDLETDVRLIREARERADQTARRAEEQARQRAAREQAAAARERAEQARQDAEAQRQLQLAAAAPAVARAPIDDEVFFAGLPAPTLLAYARLFKRLTAGGAAVQSLAAEGVPLEMIAVINETWGALFQQRPELALRFSVLISAAWA